MRKRVFVFLNLSDDLAKKANLILPYANQIMHGLFTRFISDLSGKEIEELFWSLHGKSFYQRQKEIDRFLRERVGRIKQDRGEGFSIDRFSDLL